MSCSNPLLYSPAAGHDATDTPLSVFRPTDSVDSDSDYTNVEVSFSFTPRAGFRLSLGFSGALVD